MALTIEQLDLASRDQLVEAWKAEFGGGSPPQKISQRLMRMIIAFEVQAKKYGGLSSSAKRQLSLVRDGKTAVSTSPLSPGTRLVREWNGINHVVDVAEDGSVLWNGQRYRSLTAVAHAVTGVHWSGPRFFGLTK